MTTNQPAAQQQDPTKELATRVELETKNALAAFSLNEETFAPIKAKWMAVTLTGPEDENLEGMAEIYRKAAKTRTAIEATRKSVKDPFLKAGQAIDNRAKQLTGMVTPLESHAKTQLDKVERIKAERLQAFRMARIKTMQEAGFLYDGMFYTAGSVMVDPARVEQFPDAEFVNIVEQGRTEAAAIAKRLAEQKAELERLEKLKAEMPAEAVQAAQQPTTTPPAPMRMVYQGGEIVPESEAAAVARAGAATMPASDSNAPAATKSFAEYMNDAYKDGVNRTVAKALEIFNDPNIKTRGEVRAAVEALRL